MRQSLSWDELAAEVGRLAELITTKPDSIGVVMRGGMVPARILASKLRVPTVYGITLTKNGSERQMVVNVSDNMVGKTVLVVEDMLETGVSLMAVKAYFEELGATVQTAALYILPTAQIKPDYYLNERQDVPHFPWED